MALISNDYAVFHRLLHDPNVRVCWTGDSLMATGATANQIFLRLFPFDALGGVGFGGAGLGQPDAAYGLRVGGYSNWVTASPTGEYKQFTDAGFGAGRSYNSRMEVTFPNLTIDQSDGAAWRNNMAPSMFLIGADSGRYEWNRFEPWAKQAGTTISYDLLTYEDNLPASVMYMQGRRFHNGAHESPFMTSSPWPRNVGWNLRTVSGTSVDYNGYMELAARGNHGVATTTSHKFSVYEMRHRIGTGTIISFHAKGSSTLLDWINESYCSPTDLAAAHGLLGTTMFIRQGSGNGVPGSIGTKAAWKTATETYIEQRRAAAPGCDIILTSPIRVADNSVNALFAQFAEADEEVARSFGRGVATANMMTMMPPHRTMFQTRYDGWAQDTYYDAGWVVTDLGVYYATVTAHTSTATRPASDTTNYKALTGVDASRYGGWSRANNMLMDPSHPNYGSGAAGYVMSFAALCQRGAGEYARGRRSILAGKVTA